MQTPASDQGPVPTGRSIRPAALVGLSFAVAAGVAAAVYLLRPEPEPPKLFFLQESHTEFVFTAGPGLEVLGWVAGVAVVAGLAVGLCAGPWSVVPGALLSGPVPILRVTSSRTEGKGVPT